MPTEMTNRHQRRDDAFGEKPVSGGLYLYVPLPIVRQAFRKAIRRVPRKDQPFARMVFRHYYIQPDDGRPIGVRIAEELSVSVQAYRKHRKRLTLEMERKNRLWPYRSPVWALLER